VKIVFRTRLNFELLHLFELLVYRFVEIKEVLLRVMQIPKQSDQRNDVVSAAQSQPGEGVLARKEHVSLKLHIIQ
jgi:hypothetical protein